VYEVKSQLICSC